MTEIPNTWDKKTNSNEIKRMTFPKGKKEPLYCPNCGCFTRGKINTPGSLLIEIILWMIMIIPGLIYSIWRHTSRKNICTECGSGELLPYNSMRTKKDLSIDEYNRNLKDYLKKKD